MHIKSKLVFTIIAALATSMAQASYPGFNAGAICNGYTTITGKVTKLTSTTSYDGYEETWTEVTTDNGQKYGGKIYYRKPLESGFKPMILLLQTNLMSEADKINTKVTICIKQNAIYAVELTNRTKS